MSGASIWNTRPCPPVAARVTTRGSTPRRKVRKQRRQKWSGVRSRKESPQGSCFRPGAPSRTVLDINRGNKPPPLHLFRRQDRMVGVPHRSNSPLPEVGRVPACGRHGVTETPLASPQPRAPTKVVETTRAADLLPLNHQLPHKKRENNPPLCPTVSPSRIGKGSGGGRIIARANPGLWTLAAP
jgi:hypothetical protein